MIVYKYQLHLVLMQFDWPVGSEVVLAGVQKKDLRGNNIADPKAYMWVVHKTDPGAMASHDEVETRSFVIAGTGHELPSSAKHVLSWQDEPFVWHLFELL